MELRTFRLFASNARGFHASSALALTAISAALAGTALMADTSFSSAFDGPGLDANLTNTYSETDTALTLSGTAAFTGGATQNYRSYVSTVESDYAVSTNNWTATIEVRNSGFIGAQLYFGLGTGTTAGFGDPTYGTPQGSTATQPATFMMMYDPAFEDNGDRSLGLVRKPSNGAYFTGETNYSDAQFDTLVGTSGGVADSAFYRYTMAYDSSAQTLTFDVDQIDAFGGTVIRSGAGNTGVLSLAGMGYDATNGKIFFGGNHSTFDNLAVNVTPPPTSGTWTNPAGGTWDTAGNWLDNLVATGNGSIAYFNTLNITADTTVDLDSARTICNLVFGDTDTSSAAGWTLANNAVPANILTLAGTTPTITVNALGGTKTALISAVVDGTSGLTKSGTGTLTLSGENTYKGNTILRAGTLRLGNGISPTNLADSANVIVLPGGMLDLDYTGTDRINALWVDGSRLPPGVYSSTSGFITGTGTLTVTTGSASATYAIWSGRGMYHLTGGPSDDDDHDGITNFEEYAFGLVPNDGASCTPISVELDKRRGTFSYKRRQPSPGSNLGYSVWFSENLVDWTEDPSAAEGTPVLSGEIEAVEVSLSDLPGSPLPEKLFIQVRARSLVESPLPNGETRTVMLQFQSAAGAEALAFPETGDLQVGGALWNCQTQTIPVPGRQDCEDITVTVKLLEGEATTASISYIREFSDWDPAGYVMIPGAVYNGNRFEVSPQGYPPLWRDSSQFRVNMPITFTDQPRLNKDGSPGKIELDTGASSTPAMGLRTVEGSGFLLLTQQQCEFGNLGLTIEEQPAEKRLKLVVTAPRSRSRIPNMMGFGAGDPPRDWKAGDTATIRMRAWRFPAPAIQTLFDRFAESRKDLEPSAPVNAIPFSAAWHLVEDKLNDNNWNENLGFYCHGNTTSATKPLYDYWQLGWVSGGINTIANIMQGNDLSRSRAQRTLDFMFTKTPAQSGFWYGASDGVGFYGDGFSEPHPHNLSMVRKQADGLAFGMKQLLLMREQNSSVPPAWEVSARGLADAFIHHWQKYGQLGQFIDIETGDILVGGSTAGAHVPAGLVRAAHYFNEPTYLQAAEEIARYFLNNDLQSGVTCGGPGEALAAPDSESAFALAESFVELQQATGKPEWASAARDAVRQCASWVVSYDYRFPETSTLAQVNARATGAVIANVQNKHAAPGICTLSGDSLFKLWRATGDETALDLVRDIAHGIPQYLSRPDRLLGTIGAGWMCERVNLSDWEGGNNVGGNVSFNAIWCENALILTTAEIPGVYVNTDTKRVIVFDHVTAQLEGDKLVIHNPTQFNANVKVLIENNADASSPLGSWTLKNATPLAVPAGGSAEISIRAN